MKRILIFCFGVFVLVGLVLLLPTSVIADSHSGGDLDVEFGDGGRVITDLGDGTERTYDVEIQGDGKIVVAGETWDDTKSKYVFMLARYNPDGTPDISFDGDGIVTTDIGYPSNWLSAIKILNNGKIVAVGTLLGHGIYPHSIVVLRYNPNGTLDTTFGVDGSTIYSYGDIFATSVDIQPDEKIMVGGFMIPPNGSNMDFMVARFFPEGGFDVTFSNPVINLDFDNGTDYLSKIAIQPDGKIVALGYTKAVRTGQDEYFNFALARYNPDATLDTTFGVNGTVVTDISGYHDYGEDFVILDDGKILVAGSTHTYPYFDFSLVQYNSDGSLDTTFGTNGVVITDIGINNNSVDPNDYVEAITLQPDGKIIVAGYTLGEGTHYDFALARYNPDGSLDTSFGPDLNGIVITDLNNTKEILYDVEIHQEGILATGYRNNGVDDDIFLAKYTGGFTPGQSQKEIQLTDSQDNGLAGATAEYSYLGDWIAIPGSTNAEGKLPYDVPEGTDLFRLSYAGGVAEKSQNINENPLVSFQTVEVTARLENSSGDGLEGGEAEYGMEELQFFGTTDAAGVVTKELLPIAYEFQLTYLDGVMVKNQDINVDPVVVFSTAQMLVADPGGPYFLGEGSSLYLDGSQSYGPVGNEMLAYAWDLDFDGITFEIDSTNPNPLFETASLDGPTTREIALQVSDGLGGFSRIAATVVNVTNVAPTIALNGDLTTNEGATYTLNLGAVSDPGEDTVSTYIVHWGDGDSDTFTENGDVTHVYADGLASRTIFVDLVDEDGFYPEANSWEITVNNVSPTIALNGNTSVDEGSEYTLTLGEIIDPGDDSITGFIVRWGDGEVTNYSNAGNVIHVYADGPAPFEIQVDLEDEDGVHTNAGVLSVYVNNLPPDIQLTGDADVDEGAEYNLNLGLVTDPGEDTVSAYIVHWGDGSMDTYTQPGDVNHIYNDGPNTVLVAVDLVDEEGVYAAAGTLDISIHNVAPLIENIIAPVDPININEQPVSLEVIFTDPGADTHRVTWEWGDGTSDTIVNTTSPSPASHVYSETGIYTVNCTVTDEDGEFDTGEYKYIVIYNPAGGFVTGRGGIWSEAGWCQLDSDCSNADGKAKYGFNAKYKPNSFIPIGNTKFDFDGLKFKSESYFWLVITQDGINSQFKGTGTINNAYSPNGTPYIFMVWADDLGAAGEDTFRIKIWYEDASGGQIVVYDNNSEQIIEQGDIKIKKE